MGGNNPIGAEEGDLLQISGEEDGDISMAANHHQRPNGEDLHLALAVVGNEWLGGWRVEGGEGGLVPGKVNGGAVHSPVVILSREKKGEKQGGNDPAVTIGLALVVHK